MLTEFVTSSKTRSRKKDRRRDGSDRKKMKKTKQLLDYRKETKGFWILKEEALGRTLWGTSFGRGYELVVRKTRK